jgi:hypothetical protein
MTKELSVTKASKQLLSIAIALTSTVGVAAQEKPQAVQEKLAAAQPGRPAAQAVSLKVSLVFSRFQGDKKISSIPHTVMVSADGTRTSLRLGTQIPVPTSMVNDKGEKSQTYSYRDVGTNIDCTALAVPQDGTYKLSITISDSSVYYPDQSEAAARSVTATGAPAFRAFNTTFVVVLHDGQAAPTTSVTDPISGQVIKVDATINVQK